MKMTHITAKKKIETLGDLRELVTDLKWRYDLPDSCKLNIKSDDNFIYLLVDVDVSKDNKIVSIDYEVR